MSTRIQTSIPALAIGLVLPIVTGVSFASDWRRPVQAPRGAPNILLILLDDVGFGDTSTFGGAAKTPQLDRLASAGLRYNRFHTTGVCSPTRAALLSGRNHHRVGFGAFGGVDEPGYHGFWPKETVAVAEVLRRGGYSTAAFGKWHNTPREEITAVGPFDRWPTSLGFEYYYGNMLGVSSQWEPPLWRNTLPVQQPRTWAEGYHLTSDLVDDAIRWIQTHESLAHDKPYFVHFATGAAHAPHHVSPEWIERYRGKFDQGWDRLRAETFRRQQNLGVVPRDAELTPRPRELPAWSSLSADEKLLFARQMEVYAAFISHTDHEIGRLIETVRTGPGGDNTLILYIVGDNGPDGQNIVGLEHVSQYSGASPPTPIKERLLRMHELGGPEHTNEYAAGWAWAGATPFQWSKTTASHFGATRNPLVVSWPARIKDASGAVRTQFTHANDVAATLYEVSGIAMPDIIDGVRQQPLDGVSFADSFTDAEAASHHRVQYFELWGNRAIYQDGWVAAARHAVPWLHTNDESFEDDPWELYHIDDDFSQAKDLARKHPAKLAQLQALFDREARDNQVYPLLSKFFEGRPPTDRQQMFVYRQGFPSIPAVCGPSFSAAAAFTITADVTVPGGGAHGAILAVGGRDGGMSLYVIDNRVVYERNCFNSTPAVIRASDPLPEGSVVLRYVYHADGDGHESKGALYVNDRLVGAMRVAAAKACSSLDNFDVGQDSASPVSRAYQPPFAFNGVVNSVRVELK